MYPEAASVIFSDACVDDDIGGGDDVSTFEKLQHDLSEMMKSGVFDLKNAQATLLKCSSKILKVKERSNYPSN